MVESKVTRSPAAHPVTRLPDPGDDSRRLVPHDDRGAAPAGAPVHPVHVAAANAAGLDGHKHFIRAGLRVGHVFEGELFVCFENQGFHRA